MKKSKKSKLITSLSSVAVVSTVAPLAATGFTIDDKKDKNNKKTNNLTSTSNATVNMQNIGWIKTSNTLTNNKDTIKANVISDNNVNFTKYRKLKANVDITVADGTASNTFDVTISPKKDQSYVDGDPVTWTMKYIAPSPTPTTDISIDASSIKRSIDFYAKAEDRTFKITATEGTNPITLDSTNCTISSSDQTVLTVSTYDTANGFTITPKKKGLASVYITVTGTSSAVGTTEVPVLINLDDVVAGDYETIKGYADNNNLIVGQKYRITDYAATVPTTLTGITSASNPFDIIISASSTGTFFEDAKAVKNTDNTYFDNSNLDAWQVKYDINNDATKYEWADTNTGKGVIYFMRDEFANEAPYDFKSILFSGKYTFDNAGTDASLTNKVSSNSILAYTLDGVQQLNNITFNVGDTTCYNNHFGLGCSDITLGNDAVNNNFGSNCFDITLCDGSSLNSFGSNCNTIKVNQAATPVKNAFVGNIIGNDCTEITFNIGNEGGNNPKYILYNTFDQGVTEVTIQKVDFMRNTLLSSVTNAEFIEDTYNKILSSGPIPVKKGQITYTAPSAISIASVPQSQIDFGSAVIADNTGTAVTSGQEGAFSLEWTEKSANATAPNITIVGSYSNNKWSLQSNNATTEGVITRENNGEYEVAVKWTPTDTTLAPATSITKVDVTIDIPQPPITLSSPVAEPDTDVVTAGDTITYTKHKVDGQFKLTASEAIEQKTGETLTFAVTVGGQSDTITAQLDGRDSTNKTVLVTIPNAHDDISNKSIEVSCTGATRTITSWSGTINIDTFTITLNPNSQGTNMTYDAASGFAIAKSTQLASIAITATSEITNPTWRVVVDQGSGSEQVLANAMSGSATAYTLTIPANTFVDHNEHTISVSDTTSQTAVVALSTKIKAIATSHFVTFTPTSTDELTIDENTTFPYTIGTATFKRDTGTLITDTWDPTTDGTVTIKWSRTEGEGSVSDMTNVTPVWNNSAWEIQIPSGQLAAANNSHYNVRIQWVLPDSGGTVTPIVDNPQKINVNITEHYVINTPVATGGEFIDGANPRWDVTEDDIETNDALLTFTTPTIVNSNAEGWSGTIGGEAISKTEATTPGQLWLDTNTAGKAILKIKSGDAASIVSGEVVMTYEDSLGKQGEYTFDINPGDSKLKTITLLDTGTHACTIDPANNSMVMDNITSERFGTIGDYINFKFHIDGVTPASDMFTISTDKQEENKAVPANITADGNNFNVNIKKIDLESIALNGQFTIEPVDRTAFKPLTVAVTSANRIEYTWTPEPQFKTDPDYQDPVKIDTEYNFQRIYFRIPDSGYNDGNIEFTNQPQINFSIASPTANIVEWVCLNKDGNAVTENTDKIKFSYSSNTATMLFQEGYKGDCTWTTKEDYYRIRVLYNYIGNKTILSEFWIACTTYLP